MVAGENGDHGLPIAPQTVCKKERGRGRGLEHALIPLHKAMESTVTEKTPTRRIVVGISMLICFVL